MKRLAVACYGFLAYLAFLLPIGYLVGGLGAEQLGVGPLLVALGIATVTGTAAIAILDRRLLALDVTAAPTDEREADAEAVSQRVAEPR